MYLAASKYAQDGGAIYIGHWSFHWCVDGPVKVLHGRVVTVRERPRREIIVYAARRRFGVRLWPHFGYCSHGFRRAAWWHRCDYVTTENPDGRPSEEELWGDES